MFTGSTASGRRIASAAGEQLIGTSLELGGKNAMIVLNDADVDRVAEGAISACFSSAGQLCVSIERMYIHERVYDELVARLVARVQAMRVGAGYDFGYDMGSLTNPEQLDTVCAHVEDAVTKDALALAGGRARPDLGRLFFEPTLLANVTPEMTCYRGETFGPVVSLYRFATDDEAIAQANDTPYGLNASVWTRDSRRGRALAARVNAGTVNINNGYAAAWGSVDAPMGGTGDSGLGRRHGSDGLLKYTEAQTIAHQRLQVISPPPRVSFATWSSVLTAAVKAIRWAGLQ